MTPNPSSYYLLVVESQFICHTLFYIEFDVQYRVLDEQSVRSIEITINHLKV